MNDYERVEISRKREYKVVKANELIQKSRFELSLPEQKTIAYICSMIKPAPVTGAFQLQYTFSVRDYCKVCGIDYDNGKNYANIKALLKHLSDRSMWLEEGNSEILVRWLSHVKLNKRSGLAEIELDRELVPYLFALSQNFTQYELYNILAMKSAFSVRLYELLKSYSYSGRSREKTFDLLELKKLLAVETVKSYDRFPDFRRKVLDIAMREINEYTDLSISYEPITQGRKVIKVVFHIVQKSPVEKMLSANTAIDALGVEL